MDLLVNIEGSTTLKDLWVRTPRKRVRPALRIFAFPYSGANASMFFPWAMIFPDSIEVSAIQYPGHGDRVGESFSTRIDELVIPITQALLPLMDLPFVLFGHSLGALIVFEITRYLQKSGKAMPRWIFLSGHGAPHLPDRNPRIHNLPDEEFIRKIISLGGMEEGIISNNELMELVLPALKADFEVCETYHFNHEKILDCPLSAFGGLEDPYVTKEELYAWKDHTQKEFLVRMFPGDHFYLNNSRHLLIQMMMKDLKEFLI